MLVLRGLCNVFDRWKGFLILVDNVEKAFQVAKQEGDKNKIERIADEAEESKDIKNEYEVVILQEISKFRDKYRTKKFEIINEFKELCDQVYVGVSIV